MSDQSTSVGTADDRTVTYASLTTSAATDIVAACVRRAESMSRDVGVVVVDSSGGMLVGRRPHTRNESMLDLALAKAFTAVNMGIRTADVENWFSDKPGIMEISKMFAKRPVMTGPGGFPVFVDGSVVGAVGVSGAPGDEDDVILQSVFEELGWASR